MNFSVKCLTVWNKNKNDFIHYLHTDMILTDVYSTAKPTGLAQFVNGWEKELIVQNLAIKNKYILYFFHIKTLNLSLPFLGISGSIDTSHIR